MASPLLLSFLDTYSLSVSSLGCKALCIVISFLVFWPICWSSSIDCFNNGPENLLSLVSSSFLVSLRYSFVIFFFPLRLFDDVHFQYLQVFSFFQNVLILSWFDHSFNIIIIIAVVVVVFYHYLLIRVFHISISWWSFTGVWVTASLLKSLGFFSVFWPFSIMLKFGWSPLVRQLPCSPVLILWYFWYSN